MGAAIHLGIGAKRPAIKPYYAATREGLKRITVAVSPADHKRLRRLAVEVERSIEDLMKEAVDDIFAKHGA